MSARPLIVASLCFATLAWCGPAFGARSPEGSQFGRSIIRVSNPSSMSAGRRHVASRFRILHVFEGGKHDGYWPLGGLVEQSGTLYGATIGGGATDLGSVFQLTSGGVESLLYSFKRRRDGNSPVAGLTAVGGILYGTTRGGGAHAGGTVFSIDTAGVESIRYSFKSSGDGQDPDTRLVELRRELYGTTYDGGIAPYGNGFGSIFGVNAAGRETQLYGFKGPPDGAFPVGDMIQLDGVLYGTTESGGAHNCGSVFSFSPSAGEHVIYSFSGPDGCGPASNLIVIGETLYGSTIGGGTSSDGTVFSLAPSGVEHVLYSFGGSPDGSQPSGALLSRSGVIFGTAAGGTHCPNVGGTENCFGVIFRVTTSGTETILHDFDLSDGESPNGLVRVGDTLYGTTQLGGSRSTKCSSMGGCGIAFALDI